MSKNYNSMMREEEIKEEADFGLRKILKTYFCQVLNAYPDEELDKGVDEMIATLQGDSRIKEMFFDTGEIYELYPEIIVGLYDMEEFREIFIDYKKKERKVKFIVEKDLSNMLVMRPSKCEGSVSQVVIGPMEFLSYYGPQEEIFDDLCKLPKPYRFSIRTVEKGEAVAECEYWTDKFRHGMLYSLKLDGREWKITKKRETWIKEL